MSKRGSSWVPAQGQSAPALPGWGAPGPVPHPAWTHAHPVAADASLRPRRQTPTTRSRAASRCPPTTGSAGPPPRLPHPRGPPEGSQGPNRRAGGSRRHATLGVTCSATSSSARAQNTPARVALSPTCGSVPNMRLCPRCVRLCPRRVGLCPVCGSVPTLLPLGAWPLQGSRQRGGQRGRG